MQHAHTPAPTHARRWGDGIVVLALIVMMLIGGYLRLVGNNWDDWSYLHPDERFLNEVASSLGGAHWLVYTDPSTLTAERAAIGARCRERYPASGGVGGYFDAECSTWNPHNANPRFGTFVYGTLPLFTTRIVAEGLAQVTGDPTHMQFFGIHLVWRVLSGLAETGVVVVVFLMGTRLHDKWIGLLAAALYSFTAFSIQQAHFGTTDAMSNLFSALCILFAMNVQRDGKLRDYLFFGIFFGCALASRINLLPLAGLLALAAGIRLLPTFARGYDADQRGAQWTTVTVGALLAIVGTLVVFRIGNPYTFLGPGIFGLAPNARWFEDIGEVQYLVSGQWDAPPNWQWVARPRYLFPLWNLVLWGTGVAFGLTALIGLVWASWRIIRARPGALANLIPVVWVVVYFAIMGRQWVMTMRYFLPLYPVLALLAAWALITLLRGARMPALALPPPSVLRRVAGGSAIVGVVGFTLLWAVMFSNIYRHLNNRVAASYWFWEQVPTDFSMRIDDAPEGTPLINIPLLNSFLPGENYDLTGLATRFNFAGANFAADFVAPASGMVSSIHAPHLGDLTDTPEAEALTFAIYRVRDASQIASAALVADLDRDDHPLGRAYDIAFDAPFEVVEGETYRFEVELTAGANVVVGGSVAVWEGEWDDPLPVKTCTPTDGLSLADNPPPGRFSAQDCSGRDAYWALLTGGYKLEMTANDTAANRERMAQLLEDTDYIIISSNRFYDSMTRNPARWPMTNRYYEALFNGELGFEVAAVFNRAFGLGPLEIPDNHLPFFDAPAWLNEFEAEEAFHVYDHPVVIVMRKRADYQPNQARVVLESVPLTPSIAAQPVNLCAGGTDAPSCRCPENPDAYYCDSTLIDYDPVTSLEMSRTPNNLMLPDDSRALQEQGGTWSARFDSDSLLNTQPVVTVLVWWLTIAVFGWAAFPLLFAIFPALADRGYGLAKMAGVLLVAWGTWYIASLRAPVWNSGGVLVGLIVLALLSAVIVWRRRAEFVTWLRRRWRLVLGIEAITLACFVVFLGVRLTNPDLWHYAFGGEKPMDFAYFNAVLRSSIFPPYDPWFAGGYINYYYFGFVITGAPTLLLGILPSIAYNLNIPTLFALTGIGAFSVAFSLVESWRVFQPRTRAADADPADEAPARRPAHGSPWVAGFAALFLAVVLGNLDTPRTFFSALATLGGYQQPSGVTRFLLDEGLANADPNAPLDYVALEQRASSPSLIDHVRYELSNLASQIGSVARGAAAVVQGVPLPLAPHRWYWGPTRILGETPGVEGNAIAEMPFFTFLYGDLHAHMVAMPLHFLALGFLLNEVLSARGGHRTRLQGALAIALGALTVGMLLPTNSWDWITYILLMTLGLSYAWWLGYERINRRSLVALVASVGGFLALSWLAALPFSSWFASAYTSVQAWTGGKTPLWAYFSIYGLFLLLLISVLVWDTGRWLREVRVRALRGIVPFLIAGALLIGTALLGALVAALAGYQVALIAAPLLIWIMILFFRPGQSRAMQFWLALSGLALALTLGVEIVVLSGDIGRQNTVFKFYIQAWLLLSVTGGAAFAWLWQSAERWTGFLRNGWTWAVLLLVGIAGLYPVMASYGRALDRFSREVPLTLDGMAYMNYAEYGENNQWIDLADDYGVIRWLQEHVEGLPTIMEGQSEPNLYKWGSRISIYTGLPAVIGWDWHQTQQRALHNMTAFVRQRGSNVNAFYSTSDIDLALRMIDFYGVDYIVVSTLERLYYPLDGLEKFEQMTRLGLLERVYQEGNARIYRVVTADRVEVAAGGG